MLEFIGSSEFFSEVEDARQEVWEVQERGEVDWTEQDDMQDDLAREEWLATH